MLQQEVLDSVNTIFRRDSSYYMSSFVISSSFSVWIMSNVTENKLYWFLLVLYIAIKHFLDWRCIKLIITNDKLIIKKGLINVSNTEYLLTKIESIEIKNSVFNKNSGDLKINGTGGNVHIVKNMPKCYDIQECIYKKLDNMKNKVKGL